MTYAALLLPLAVAAILAGLTATTHRKLPPPVAARAIAASVVVVAIAALPSIWLLALSYIAHLPIVGNSLQWCAKAVGLHNEVPWFVGAPALIVATIGSPRAVKVWRLDRRIRIHTPGPIEYVDSADPYAVTVPGRGGRIIISTGLLGVVDDAELEAVIAHEETHANFRHDRYLLTARLVAAAIPIMRPITTRLQFTLERWADEHAARRCRDRNIIAAALAKVALAQPIHSPLLAFGNLGVTARVQALVGAPPPRQNRSASLILWSAIAVTAALGALQLHHLGSVIAALCPT